MANIGGFRGWHLCAEVTGRESNSISVQAWIHADPYFSCAWGARTMTAVCNGETKTAPINAMNNSGNTDSNIAYFTFEGLAPNTSYRIDFSYDIRANLKNDAGVKEYQGTWTGYLETSTTNPVYWNDINAYYPDGTTQNGLVFNLSLSDGSVWYDITNEPEGFVRERGVTATISNIRPNVTGAHYSGNNVTNNIIDTFSWTFNTADWICELYTAWNVYAICYNSNGGTGAPDSQVKTYGTNLVLSNTIPTRTGYTFLGWSMDSTATSASYTAGETLTSDLTTTNGDILTFYAVWAINSYRLDLNGWLDGVDSNDLGSYGTATVVVNGTTMEENVTDYFSLHEYGSTYSITNINANQGYQYNGVHSGSINGSIGADKTTVTLDFSTKVPTDLTISGKVNSPFEISLNWNATGLDCNYRVYANDTVIYSGTDTSFIYNCAEETTYNIYFTATNAGGTTTSNIISLSTPADQAKIKIKKDGVWQRGKAYYKKDGQWVKAKKIYIKIDGQWKINNNEEV